MSVPYSKGVEFHVISMEYNQILRSSISFSSLKKKNQKITTVVIYLSYSYISSEIIQCHFVDIIIYTAEVHLYIECALF